jgi:5-hydroxyisourate hydrolase
MSAITTHVLDVAVGRPAAGMEVRLEHITPTGNEAIASATTDSGGRVASLGPERIEPGTYRLVFDTGGYLSRDGDSSGRGIDTAPFVPFFPEITVTFAVANGGEHYHIPLLMSPFGYSTYRGS